MMSPPSLRFRDKAKRSPIPPRSQRRPWWDRSRFRVILVWLILVLGAGGLLANLYRLQILNGTKLSDLARAQQTTMIRPYIPRRPIVDQQGNVLATDQLVYELYVHPVLFNQPESLVAQTLSPILGDTTPQELLKRFASQKSGIRLRTNLREDQADAIRVLQSPSEDPQDEGKNRPGLNGLELNQRYQRYYPQGDAVAEVLGYVNGDHVGQAGLEYSQQKLLERSGITLQVERTGKGDLLPVQISSDALNSEDLSLQLTLNLALQREAHRILRETVEKFKAKRGAVIVMDVRDGAIIALASEPTYNPNAYALAPMSLFKNWTVTDVYEPGSTFKPVNVALALDAGKIKPDTQVYDPGEVKADRWTIYNHDYRTQGGHGLIDVAKILQVSSNVGMVKLMRNFTGKEFYQALLNLGLEEKLGIELPGEVVGHLKPKAVFTRSSIEPATTAFGQGFSLTPMKLVQLHAALANGGKLVTPHLIEGLVDTQDYFHWRPVLKTRQVLKPETSKTVMQLMETVVDKGSGKVSRIPGYRIAGKTGTAQKASAYGGYDATAKITSFIASFPVDDPRYVVLALVDEPKGANTFGSTVAAPVVRSVLESLILLEKVPPSQPLR